MCPLILPNIKVQLPKGVKFRWREPLEVWHHFACSSAWHAKCEPLYLLRLFYVKCPSCQTFSHLGSGTHDTSLNPSDIDNQIQHIHLYSANYTSILIHEEGRRNENGIVQIADIKVIHVETRSYTHQQLKCLTSCSCSSHSCFLRTKLEKEHYREKKELFMYLLNDTNYICCCFIFFAIFFAIF